MITGHYYGIPRTAIEVFEILPEGTLCQVIDNVIYMSPAPSFEHQDTVAEITTQVRSYVNKSKSGKCIPSPIDVFLDSKNAFQPDIIFIANENLSIVRDGSVKGAPDIVVEVLSAGTREHDLGKKRTAYERNGVREYFVVDPKTKDVQAFYLKKEKYDAQPKAKSKIVSKLLRKTFKF